MQSFPLFMSLQDRRALIVGGGESAARKTELLLSAGAQVALIAETVGGEIAQLIADGRISWAGHTFDEADLTGMSLVIVASDDDFLQAYVSQVAQRNCVPVNVVDRPALSSFIMPAIVDRGPVVAISTGGARPPGPPAAAPNRARAARAIGRLARFAEIFRPQVRRTLTEPRAAAASGTACSRPDRRAGAGRRRDRRPPRTDPAARRRPQANRADAGHGASGGRRPRRSRSPDAQGPSPAAARRRGGLRPAGVARGAGDGAARRRAALCRQACVASLAAAGRDQRSPGGAGARRQERGAAEGRRSWCSAAAARRSRP